MGTDCFDNLLNSFENLIFSDTVKENFTKSEKKFLAHLVRNIHSDFRAMHLLLKNNYLVQAQKLARHDFEAVVLLAYLDSCGDKYSQEDYLADSHICNLRNLFFDYKKCKENKKTFRFMYDNGNGVLSEANLSEDLNPEKFILSDINALYNEIPKIRSEISALSNENLEDWEKYFKLNNFKRKIKFMKIGEMIDGLEECNECKPFLKERLRTNYDFYSQIAHNKLPMTSQKPTSKNIECMNLYEFIKTIIGVICEILLTNGIISDSSEELQALIAILESPL